MVDARSHTHSHGPGGPPTAAHERLHEEDPDAAIAAAIATLRTAGERVTGARRSVIAALAHDVDHLSAEQVASRVQSASRSAHRATVYRTLEMLADVGAVTTMQVAGGATVFHLASASAANDHLHARCRVCGLVTVLPVHALADATRELAASDGFRLEPAQSTFVGRCASCTAAERTAAS